MVRYGQVWSGMVMICIVWSGIAYLAIIIGHGVSHITCRWDLKFEKERGPGPGRCSEGSIGRLECSIIVLYYVFTSHKA